MFLISYIRKILFVWLLTATIGFGYAQNRKIDSLLSLIKIEKKETSRLDYTNTVSREFINIGMYHEGYRYANNVIDNCNRLLSASNSSNSDSLILNKKATALNNIGVLCKEQGDFVNALEHLSKALKIDEEINDHSGMAKRFGNIGIVYMNKGDYSNALDYFTKSLAIDESFDNKKGIASSCSNIGLVCYYKGDFPSALSSYFKALKMAEALENKSMVSTIYGNLGLVYNAQKNSEKALVYYFKALQLDEEIGNKSGVARHLSTIGLVHSDRGEYEKALEYYNRSLKINEEIENEDGKINQLGNIGIVYKQMAEENKNAGQHSALFELALDYDFKALNLAKQAGDKRSMTINLGNIAGIYAVLKNYITAEQYYLEALKVDTLIGFLHHLSNTYCELSVLYEATGKYQKSVDYYRLYQSTKDKLYNEEKSKEITRYEMTYEFERKQDALKAEQEKRELVAKAEKKRQNIWIWLIAIVAFFVALITVVVFRSLQIARKQKQIIESQKELVEEKQREIMDSIYYARRIQRSLLPTEKYIDKSFKRLIQR